MQEKLQKLQNRAARVLTYSNYGTDVNNLFELLRWKSLVSQRQIERATMVFKSLQGLAPEYLCSKFVHRDSGQFLFERLCEQGNCSAAAHKLLQKNSFSYSSAVLWNSLPLEVRKAEYLNQFKRLIKEVIQALILNTAFMESSFYFM